MHNWTNAQFNAVLDQPNYRLTVDSWREQRSFLESAIKVLESSTDGPQYGRLAATARAALSALAPVRPSPEALGRAGFEKVAGSAAAQANQTFTCGSTTVRFGLDASLDTLIVDGTAWASESGRLGRRCLLCGTPATFAIINVMRLCVQVYLPNA
jgi:hypothetical protein